MSDTTQAVKDSCDWYDVPCAVSGGLDWFWNAVTYVPRLIWSGILDAAAYVVEAIPVPDAVATTKANLGAWAAGSGYLVDMFSLKAGLSMIFAALIARFMLRRIPFIG